MCPDFSLEARSCPSALRAPPPRPPSDGRVVCYRLGLLCGVPCALLPSQGRCGDALSGCQVPWRRAGCGAHGSGFGVRSGGLGRCMLPVPLSPPPVVDGAGAEKPPEQGTLRTQKLDALLWLLHKCPAGRSSTRCSSTRCSSRSCETSPFPALQGHFL